MRGAARGGRGAAVRGMVAMRGMRGGAVRGALRGGRGAMRGAMAMRG